MIVFISIPTKGTVTDSVLSVEFLKQFAQLHTEYPNYTFISPMVTGYSILPFLTDEASWENWGHRCRKLIAVCDEMWVLMYSGWESSIGVQGEVEHAAICNKPVTFVTPQYAFSLQY